MTIGRGSRIGIVVPGLMRDFENAPPPEHLTRRTPGGGRFWDPGECFSFHTLDWWRRHWGQTERVEILRADTLANGWRDWLQFERAKVAAGTNRHDDEIPALEADQGALPRLRPPDRPAKGGRPMSHNPNSYDLSPVIAEAYDLHETHTTDVKMIRRLIGPRRGLRVLEPFCGTGRILIPLAQDGQTLVGLDCAGGMLVRAQGKIAQLPEDVRRRVTLVQADATAGNWPTGFDLVILGGNCFYELASADEQERCVAAAAAALKPGGYAFVDNDHMEDVLPESWTRPGKRKTGWPSGVLPDGTRLEGYTENLECDVTARIWRARRTVVIHFPEGRTETHERLQQKHPVSFAEVAGWLTKHGFAIEQTFGGHDGRPYTPDAPRATFWARRGCDA